jgi:hypothetical protein
MSQSGLIDSLFAKLARHFLDVIKDNLSRLNLTLINPTKSDQQSGLVNEFYYYYTFQKT